MEIILFGYDSSKREIMLYHKPGTSIILPEEPETLIDKFSTVGLVLKETYEKEEKAVKQVFGKDFNLHYNM